MTIEYRKGNLLDITAGIIVHGANAQGVMGSGVAKVVKEKYPECFAEYRREYEQLGLHLGSIVWWTNDMDGRDNTPFQNMLFIANGITQQEYGTDRRHVNYVAVADVFKEVIRQAKSTKLDVNFPKIGAGLGGGDWNIIEAIINDCDPLDKVRKICWEL